MQDKIKQVADRIRELRAIRGQAVLEVAPHLGLSPEQYTAYESGKVDIPVGVLYQIAHYFEVELSSLLTGEEPRLHTYALTRADKGPSVDRRQDYRYQSLAYNFLHKKAEPFLVTVDPGPEEAPEHLNSHPGQEFNYVLEGTLKIVLGTHELILNQGDSLYFDSGILHGMKALNGMPARFLAVIL
jgi:quercetin dioxygenase-like cupin family protein/DNA-binding XRE family transcriptional regulator